MNLLEAVLGAGNSGAFRQMAQQCGISEAAAQSAAAQLVPALARGLGRNAGQAGGLESLLGALQSGNHTRYVQDPALLASEQGVADGNGILGHILGSKDASRNVAAHAAQQSGLDPAILRKMLPMVAGLVMGALSQKMARGGRAQETAGSGPLDGLGIPGLGNAGASLGNLGALTSFLDADRDGSALDDVLNLAKKLF